MRQLNYYKIVNIYYLRKRKRLCRPLELIPKSQDISATTTNPNHDSKIIRGVVALRNSSFNARYPLLRVREIRAVPASNTIINDTSGSALHNIIPNEDISKQNKPTKNDIDKLVTLLQPTTTNERDRNMEKLLKKQPTGLTLLLQNSHVRLNNTDTKPKSKIQFIKERIIKPVNKILKAIFSNEVIKKVVSPVAYTAVIKNFITSRQKRQPGSEVPPADSSFDTQTGDELVGKHLANETLTTSAKVTPTPEDIHVIADKLSDVSSPEFIILIKLILTDDTLLSFFTSTATKLVNTLQTWLPFDFTVMFCIILRYCLNYYVRKTFELDDRFTKWIETHDEQYYDAVFDDVDTVRAKRLLQFMHFSFQNSVITGMDSLNNLLKYISQKL